MVYTGLLGSNWGKRPVRPLRQPRFERVPERRSKVGRSGIAVGRGLAYPQEFISRSTCRV